MPFSSINSKFKYKTLKITYKHSFIKCNNYLKSRMIQNTQTAKPQSVTHTKVKYEIIWRGIFVLVTLVGAFLSNKIYLYQTSEYFQGIKKGSFFELAVFGTLGAIIFVICDTLFHYALDEKCAQHYINKEKYPTEEARKKKAYTVVRWGFSLLYYGASSTAAFLIIQPTSFMPTWLGGDGYCTDVTRYFGTFDEANNTMKVFYIVQFGKHLGRFFQHVFIRSEGNFYQFTLHHGLSTFLIFFSYLTNQWIIGIFVLLIHDLSDFFLILARAYREIQNLKRPILNFFYFLAMSFWLFCRIFLLSTCCVYSALSSAYSLWANPEKYHPEIAEIILPCGLFMGSMLFCLQIMQLFWTYYIGSSFISVSVSSKLAKHTYD